MRRLMQLAALALVVAPAAHAQMAPGKFDVGTHIGMTKFDAAAALKDAPFIGVDGVYHFGRKISGLDLGAGFNFQASRPLTRGDQFPLIAQDFGDTTFLYQVAQRVTLLQTGLKAELGGRVGKFRAYGYGGAGAYTISVDARANTHSKTYIHQESFIGGGLNYALSQTVGIKLNLQDTWFLAYDRNRLDPTMHHLAERQWRDLTNPPDEAKGRFTNLQWSLAFNYVPSRTGASEDR